MARKGIAGGRIVLETGSAKSTFLTETVAPAQNLGIVGGRIVHDEATGIVGGTLLVHEPLPEYVVTKFIINGVIYEQHQAGPTIVGGAILAEGITLPQEAGDITVAVGLAAETDTAYAITTIADITVAVGLATETDSAQSVAPLQDVVVAVGLATETDSANTIAPTAPSNIFNIIDIDFDDTVYDGQNAVIHGTVFGAIEGQVFIGDEPQTISNWTDTEITISVVRGGLSLGAQTLRVNRPA